MYGHPCIFMRTAKALATLHLSLDCSLMRYVPKSCALTDVCKKFPYPGLESNTLCIGLICQSSYSVSTMIDNREYCDRTKYTIYDDEKQCEP